MGQDVVDLAATTLYSIILDRNSQVEQVGIGTEKRCDYG